MVHRFFMTQKNCMFWRLVTPRSGVKCPTKVFPDLCLDSNENIYIPTTEDTGACDWTFKVLDVAVDDYQRLPMLKEHFTKGLNTVIYIHGGFESVNSVSVRTIMHGYLERGDHNLLLLDWSQLGNKYIGNFFQMGKIGKRAEESLRWMEDYEVLRMSNTHVVGHSLGAHIGGYICRKFSRVKRLTGLDPTGILFKWLKIKDAPISKEDAVFVDNIHTDGTRFGTLAPLGHIDFYPNGGKSYQPGCKFCFKPKSLRPDCLCSHWMSWRFYAESLVRKDAFLAKAADCWEEFKQGKPMRSDVIPMGFETSSAGPCGLFFLQTAECSPYGKGQEGLKYIEPCKK